MVRVSGMLDRKGVYPTEPRGFGKASISKSLGQSEMVLSKGDFYRKTHKKSNSLLRQSNFSMLKVAGTKEEEGFGRKNGRQHIERSRLLQNRRSDGYLFDV